MKLTREAAEMVGKLEKLIMRGLEQYNQRDLDGAEMSFKKALKIEKNDFNALHNLGLIEMLRGDYRSAVTLIQRAVDGYSKSFLAYSNLCVAYQNIGLFEKSLEAGDKAIALKSDYATAYLNRGYARLLLERYEEAISDFNRCISLGTRTETPYLNRGIAFLKTESYTDALDDFDKAMLLNDLNPKTYKERGNALKGLDRFEEALASYDKAIELKPDDADSYYRKAAFLAELNRLDEAIENYAQGLSIQWKISAFVEHLHCKMKVCDWSDWTENFEKLTTTDEFDEDISAFPLLALIDEPRLHLRASSRNANQYRISTSPVHFSVTKKSDKIRVGYFSADFHNHPTTYLMAELFELHDKNRFEVYGFSFGPSVNDEMRRRVANSLNFHDVRDKSNKDILALSHDLKIDIALDLKGYTRDKRTAIFAERCAPIQVNYLGYPGTMGAEFIDYLIADRFVLPESERQNYTEKVVYLPHTYQVNDSKRAISERLFTRFEVGLPAEAFVFACFNNNYKITPDIFDVWMNILKSVNNSVLWLFEANPICAENLRKETTARGVDASRLVFAQHLDLAEHLARIRLADLFIDTLPCNAHTTASDALWADLPVLTCAGRSFAGRVAASLLDAVGLPELIANSLEEYQRKAIDLAANPEKSAFLKMKLQQNKLSFPLFDTKRFAGNIERAYEQMFARFNAGLPPEDIQIFEGE